MITKESPLKGMSIGTVDTVMIRELPGLHAIDLRVAPGTSTHSAVSSALGSLALPKKPGTVSLKDEAYALCLAPDWWIVVGLHGAEQKLAPLKNEHHFSVVNVSGQRTTIELEGPKVREVLAHVWEQDLREKTFPIGSVSQGLMAKAPVIVCHLAPNRYRIMVRSSFALHLWNVLEDTISDF